MSNQDMWIENFTDTENSDNRYRFQDEPDAEKIIIGGTCMHTFEVPFLVSGFCKSIEVIYKQGLTVIPVGGEAGLFVDFESVYEDEERGISIIQITLNPIQTLMFSETLLNTFVQLKVITKEDKILYDQPHYLIVRSPLRVDHVVLE